MNTWIKVSAFAIESLVLYCWNNGVDSQGMDNNKNNL